MIVTILVDLLVTSSLCIALSRLDGHGASNARAAAGKALRVWQATHAVGDCAGRHHSAAGLTLYGPLDKTISLLADSASPVALFTIGAVLARSQMTTADPTPLVDYVPVALKSRSLHPLLVLIIGGIAIDLGLPLDPSRSPSSCWRQRCPAASNVSLLAERFGADNGRIARRDSGVDGGVLYLRRPSPYWPEARPQS